MSENLNGIPKGERVEHYASLYRAEPKRMVGCIFAVPLLILHFLADLISPG